MKNYRKSFNKVKLIYIIIFMLVIALLSFFIPFVIKKQIIKKDDVQQIIENVSTEKKETISEKINKKNWDESIISNLTDEDVPVATGLEYVEGNMEIGIIEKDIYGGKRLWIPYSSEINVDVKEYYTNIDKRYYTENDNKIQDSIVKYGGFYVDLNATAKLEDLKKISEKEYLNYAEQLKNADIEESLNSHILNMIEIKQILQYLDKNQSLVSIDKIGIKASIIEEYTDVPSNIDEYCKSLEQKETEDSGENEYVYMFDAESSKYNKSVPIPSGYKFYKTNGVVKIQSKYNSNLVYIWVPFELNSQEDIAKQKEILKNNYKGYNGFNGVTFDDDSSIYQLIDNTEEKYSETWFESVKKYGGFYISEAELGYDSRGDSYNIARMTENGGIVKTLDSGDYYRGNKYSVKDMKKIANQVSLQNNSTVSHLMYGAEYDATINWILNTNQGYEKNVNNNKYNIKDILLYDSSAIGIYRNSNDIKNVENEQYLNGIWGIGGNLAEYTSEIIKIKDLEKSITRGGDYTTTGANLPIASRMYKDSLEDSTIGYRVSLYINLNSIMVTKNELENFEEENRIKNQEENDESDQEVKTQEKYIDTDGTSKDVIMVACNEKYITDEFMGTAVYDSLDFSKEPVTYIPKGVELKLVKKGYKSEKK